MRSSIKISIILVTVGLILLVVTVLTAVISTNASKAMQQTLEDELDQKVRQGSFLLMNFLKWQTTNLEVWNNQPIVKVFFKSPALAVMSRSGLQAYLRKVCENSPWLADILLIDNDTVLYDHAFPSARLYRPPNQWMTFWNNLGQGQPFIMNLGEIFKGKNRWVLVLSRAFTDNGKVEEDKRIVIFLDVSQLDRELFTNFAVSRKGFISLSCLLPDGRIVLPETSAQTDTQREFIAASREWKNLGDIPESHEKLGSMLVSAARLPHFSIQVIGVASEEEFLKPVRGIIKSSLIISLFILALGIMGAIVFSKRITAPIILLTAIVKDITFGDKTADHSLELGKLMARTDELGVMSSAFNAMLMEIRRHTAELEEKVAQRTKALADSWQYLTQIIEYLPEPTFVIDENGVVTAWNQALQELTGVKAKEMLTQGDYAYAVPFHGEKRQMLIDLVRLKTWDTSCESTYLSITKKQDGSIAAESYLPDLKGGIYLSATARELLDTSGQSAGAIESIRDITPQKTAQQKLKKQFDELTEARWAMLNMMEDLEISRKSTEDALEVISSSINYATNIQNSILPSQEVLTSQFSDYFILWEPRDRVGGDIYLLKPWGPGMMFALADCTGHGVPGAFMTMITNGAMEMAVLQAPPGDCAVLLQRTHQLIQKTLNQKEAGGASDDGLEMGICYIAPHEEDMIFSGARFSLFVVEKGDVLEIKGDKKGLGYRGIPYNQKFTNHPVQTKSLHTYYMTTDGIIDQVGGSKRRSYGKKRFKKMLLEMESIPMKQRVNHIRKAFMTYQGQQIRRDDVSVLGFTFNGRNKG